jgi:hypothetical protein
VEWWDGSDATVNLSAQATIAGNYSIQGDHYYYPYDGDWTPADPEYTYDSVYSPAIGPPTVTGDSFAYGTTWNAGTYGNISLSGFDLSGVVPTIADSGCAGAWAASAWSSSYSSVTAYLSVYVSLAVQCTLTISAPGWAAQIQLNPLPPPAISAIAPQSINDGDTGSFSVTATSGAPTSYGWSYTVPAGTNSNNPEVTFTAPNAASTGTDGHWYATDGPCASSLYPQYTITATVGFPWGGPLTGQSTLQVGVPWTPQGAYTTQATIAGAVQVAGLGSYFFVLGPGSLQRTQPVTTFYVPQTSQFYSKVAAHEQVHVNQWAAGGMFAALYQVSDLYALLSPLNDTTLVGLNAQISQVASTYFQGQSALLTAGIPAAEAQAYAVSDPIAPQYIYQGACGNNP